MRKMCELIVKSENWLAPVRFFCETPHLTQKRPFQETDSGHSLSYDAACQGTLVGEIGARYHLIQSQGDTAKA